LKKLLQDIEVSSMEKEKLDGLKTGRLPKKTLREMYPDRCHESLFGIDYYKLLRRSNIVFNLHSEAARNTVDNMKMFETTGVGACLITDTGSNMKDLFEEDKEVVTYLSVDEAIEKVKYLMDNENERKKIAEAGQSRTLREHNVRARCEIMHEIIQGRL
jgi:spore maturation protein CgeB